MRKRSVHYLLMYQFLVKALVCQLKVDRAGRVAKHRGCKRARHCGLLNRKRTQSSESTFSLGKKYELLLRSLRSNRHCYRVLCFACGCHLSRTTKPYQSHHSPVRRSNVVKRPLLSVFLASPPRSSFSLLALTFRVPSSCSSSSRFETPGRLDCKQRSTTSPTDYWPISLELQPS